MNGEESTRRAIVKFQRWMQFQANGTIDVTRSDDMGVGGGRTIVNNLQVPIWIELMGISFGCNRWTSEFAFGRLARSEKATGSSKRIRHSRPQIRAPMTNQYRRSGANVGYGLTTGQIEVVADIADSRKVTTQAFELNGWMKGMSDGGLCRQEKRVKEVADTIAVGIVRARH